MNMLYNLFEAEEGTVIPDFYIYTSGKGKKYYKKGDSWFNLETKKAVPTSNVMPLEAAARKAIEQYNASNPVKIGAKYTSSKQKVYTFNGSSFVSEEGKVLTGGAAQTAYNKLKASQGNPDSSSDIVPGESAVDDNADSGSGPSSEDLVNRLGNGDNNSDTDSGTPPPTPPAPEDNGTSDNSENSKLNDIATQIRGNRYSKQIVQLISRGGDVNLIIADILLSGKVSEAIDIIKSLNNSNTQ